MKHIFVWTLNDIGAVVLLCIFLILGLVVGAMALWGKILERFRRRKS